MEVEVADVETEWTEDEANYPGQQMAPNIQGFDGGLAQDYPELLGRVQPHEQDDEQPDKLDCEAGHQEDSCERQAEPPLPGEG